MPLPLKTKQVETATLPLDELETTSFRIARVYVRLGMLLERQRIAIEKEGRKNHEDQK